MPSSLSEANASSEQRLGCPPLERSQHRTEIAEDEVQWIQPQTSIKNCRMPSCDLQVPESKIANDRVRFGRVRSSHPAPTTSFSTGCRQQLEPVDA